MGSLARYAFYLRRLGRDLARPLIYQVAADVSSPCLGPYYFLFREEDLLAGGSMDFHFDEEGIPLISTYIDVKDARLIYYPISVGQYGLAIFHTYLQSGKAEDRERFMRIVDWFYNNSEEDDRLGCVWRSMVEVPFYKLDSGWTSAFAQSRAISVLLRGWQLTQDERYLERALLAAKPFSVDVRDGGVQSTLSGEAFYEEYPSDPPAHVLNGMMFSLFGLYDLVRVAGENAAEATDLFEAGISGLVKNLSLYDLGYWSLYDVFCPDGKDIRLNPATVHYHHIHIGQLDVLARITGNHDLQAYRRRWTDYVSLANKLRAYGGKFRLLRSHGRL